MTGRAYLVGAGPGDPGLLTMRAVELIAAADVILHDRLIPLEALRFARAGAEVVDVGKIGGGEQVPQEATTRLLVEHALAGRAVVRLKGGDPFVFGRGGEEAAALRTAGLPFEIVPGVTAGIAGPAYAGIPVTHRALARSVAFVTGHEDRTPDGPAIDWAALARIDTVVVYMGGRTARNVARRLLTAGRAPGTPAAIVVDASLPRQQVRRTDLGSLAERGAGDAAGRPALLVVGPVAALGIELAWYAAAGVGAAAGVEAAAEGA